MGNMLFMQVFQEKFFLDYNFFLKSDDLKNEHEFRFITIVNDKDNVFEIDGLSNYLEGVVVGERTNSISKKTLKMLLENSVQIKSILFDRMYIKVTE